jgi:hypothetical protein
MPGIKRRRHNIEIPCYNVEKAAVKYCADQPAGLPLFSAIRL